MKKFLSLVLALVMTMSLVTVSAGAKDFTDNSKINYKEAVDVMSAAKVIDGYAEGDFRPANTLTRGAAAKIICNLILGPTTAEALVADAAPYSDVPTTNTFAGYIAYCAKEGIISGYADGTFRPAATLSGYAFMKMLLGALGYDATTEGYTGNNWSIQVAKRALSANVDLADGLNGEFNGIKAVTREEACLYAFNTLKATMVEYENSNSVTVNGITFTNKSTAKDMKNDTKTDGNIKDDGLMQFAEKYFSDLKGTPATDDLGHPSTKWMWKKDKIGTYANDADETYTLTGTYEIGTGKDYASLLAVLKDEDFTDNKDLKLVKDVDVYVNGKEVAADSTEVKDALVNAAKGGTTVELYYNDDDKDAVDCVTILNYSIGQIKDVSTKLTKDQKDDGATSKIKVEGKWYLDNDVVGFDSKTYVEDAYVLYILKSTTEMSASQIAEEITGKVTAIKGSDKATIDGTQYKYVKNAVTIDVDDEGSFYLNAAGQIAAVDTDSKSDNYAFIYNLKKDTNKVNSDGVLADTITAYYVTTDGTKASAVVDADVETTSDGKTLFYYADTKTEVESGVVIAFSINSDGELVLETEKDTIKNNVTKTIDKTHAAGTDSDTQFIFAYADGSKFKTSTATGYKNVSVKGQQVCTVTNKDGDYLYVFVGVKNGTLSSDVQYAVVTDGKASKTKDGKDTFYSYDAIINGEESTLTFKTSTDPKLTKGAAYAFELDGKNVKDNKVTQLNFAQVTAGTKNYVEVGGTQYNLDDDVKAIYTVTLEYKSEAAYNEATKGTTLTFADLDSVTVSEGADIDNKSWVAYNVDGSDLDVLFVVDFVY